MRGWTISCEADGMDVVIWNRCVGDIFRHLKMCIYGVARDLRIVGPPECMVLLYANNVLRK